jgi:hypothetical protein
VNLTIVARALEAVSRIPRTTNTTVAAQQAKRRQRVVNRMANKLDGEKTGAEGG